MLLLSFALADGPTPVEPGTPLRGEPSTRAGFIVEGEQPIELFVVVDDERVLAEPYWTGEGVGVYFAELPREVTEVHIETADPFAAVSGELLHGPVEPRGTPPPEPGVLPDELKAIGVISRSEWGAKATNCSSLEDDWYRMAIHHTAGSQTSGGTVQGALQATQNYHLGTGTYCDIAYQFLVGYDGSLWEGRPYDYYSGATGGGNNDGNIAISFMGCYDADDCGTSHAVTDAMMEAGQRLVHTLAELHDVPLDSGSIKGHRDWPNNATACPGDLLHPRLDEFYAPLGPRWAADWVGSSFDGPLVLAPGQTVDLWLDFENIGDGTWTSNTALAPLPRDEGSALANGSWLSDTRITAVDADTPPGGIGRFTFSISAPAEEGVFEQPLGLVEEWAAWFADDGGDGSPSLAVHVEAVEKTDDTGLASDDTAPVGAVLPPGPQHPLQTGCGQVAGGGWLFGLVLVLRRQRRQGLFSRGYGEGTS